MYGRVGVLCGVAVQCVVGRVYCVVRQSTVWRGGVLCVGSVYCLLGCCTVL